jgi:small redox-active disulfide protein 2
MKVEIFGPGCPRCEEMFRTIINAAAELEIAADIQHITDAATIAERGIMSTPAVAVNGEVVLQGKTPTRARAKEILRQYYTAEK